MISLLKRNHAMAIPDSIAVEGTIKGWIDHLQASLLAHIRSPFVQGGLSLDIEKSRREVVWKLRPVNLRRESVGIQFYSTGKWTAD